MHRNVRRTLSSVGAAAVLTTASGAMPPAGATAAPASHTAPPAVSVLASGLNNPRGLTWNDGELYVTEAGTGGTDCPPNTPGPEGGPLCVGRTGAVAEVSHGAAHPLISGLISVSDLPGGLAAEGVANVAATDDGLKLIFGDSVVGVLTSVPHGSTLGPADSTALRAQLGRLTSLEHGSLTTLADVGDADFTWAAVHQDLNPQFPDANPNALLAHDGTTYVVDAASNTLDTVDRAGNVQQVAYFPNDGAADAVPSCVAAGPDGMLYVGQLAPGAAPNGSNIYRYNPANGHLSVWKTGFNVVDGCGFDHAGNFYAVEFQAHGFNPGPTGNPAGDVVKIRPDGTRTVLGSGSLFFPQGFATDNRGDIFVSNWSILTGTPSGPGRPTGQVVEISS